MTKLSLLLGVSQARYNSWQRGPRPDYSDPVKPNKLCHAEKYFQPWMASNVIQMGPRPDYIVNPEDQCAKPETDCFERVPDNSVDEISSNSNGEYTSCLNDCVGFDWTQTQESINLCSMFLAKYTAEFDKEKDYVGFVFGAIQKHNTWYFNSKVFRFVLHFNVLLKIASELPRTKMGVNSNMHLSERATQLWQQKIIFENRMDA